MPYIEKRVKELIGDKEEQKRFLKEEFVEWVGKADVGSDMISEGDKGIYERISEELLAKRNGEICPFCKESILDNPNHIKEFHKEEIKVALKNIDKEEYLQLKKKEIWKT